MPSFRTAFPSRYLRAQDLLAPIDVTVASAGLELIGIGAKSENKLILHFVESTVKAFVLNMVNSESVAEIAGTEDFDQWTGVRLRLFVTKTEFQGKRVPCIRVQAPPPPFRPTKPVSKRPTPTPPVVVDPDDDIETAMPTLDEEESF